MSYSTPLTIISHHFGYYLHFLGGGSGANVICIYISLTIIANHSFLYTGRRTERKTRKKRVGKAGKATLTERSDLSVHPSRPAKILVCVFFSCGLSRFCQRTNDQRSFSSIKKSTIHLGVFVRRRFRFAVPAWPVALANLLPFFYGDGIPDQIYNLKWGWFFAC